MPQVWKDVWEFRENIYNVFGQILVDPVNYPKHEMVKCDFWEDFPLEVANQDMEEGLSKLINCTKLLADQKASPSLDDVLAEYTKLFIGPGKPKAPIYKSFYTDDKSLYFNNSTFKMREVLYKSGLENSNKNRMPEDHLGLMLIYLSVQSNYLLDLEMPQSINNVNEQIKFIDEQMLTWLAPLLKNIVEHSEIGYYEGLVSLIKGILQWDKELLSEYLETRH